MLTVDEIFHNLEKPRHRRIIVFSGPSGSGKSTICRALLQRFPDLKFSVSHTTRERREGETHGVDYYFVNESEFRQMILDGAFAEYAYVYGNLYGTAITALGETLASDNDVLLDIDVQGGEQVLSLYADYTTMVFVMPPSLQVLKERLVKRGKDDGKVIEARLRKAAGEIEKIPIYDYVIINDDLEEAVNRAAAIIVADKSRITRYIR